MKNIKNKTQKIEIKDPASRFDLSYVFANDYPVFSKTKTALQEMAEVACEIVPGVHCRTAIVHPGEIKELVSLLKGSLVRSEVVIDFPDGSGGAITKEAQARFAASAGAIGADLVINLHKVKARDKKGLMEEFLAVTRNIKETKVIGQVPYLWQYDKNSVPWLLEILAEAGVYCLKDWTTRVDNFLLPENETLDYSDDTRFRYLEYIANYIDKHSLPIILKVAGRVSPLNVRSFVNAGATLIGLSYRKAAALRHALLK